MNWIERFRRERGMSRPEFARMAGVTESSIRRYERGVRPPARVWRALARNFGITTVELMKKAQEDGKEG